MKAAIAALVRRCNNEEMSVSPKAPGELRPGGRSARVRAAVHRAVEELLAESTVEALTIP